MDQTTTFPALPPVRQKPLINEETFQDSILWNLFLITLGSSVCAWALNGIIIPHQFLSGGVTGIILIIHYYLSDLSVGLLYFLMNIPIYIVGWMYIGRRFFLYSLAGLFIFTAAVVWIKPVCPIEDRLLGALLAGIVYGAGAGLILRSLGSAGGTDILSIILLKRYSVRIGSTVLFFNTVVLTVSALFFSLEAVLYTLIYMFVSSHVIDMVVTGLSKRKAAMIISSRWKEISRLINSDLNRGVTVVHGEGGYSGRQENILYTVVTFRELGRLKNIVRQIDPKAFVVVTDTLEVIGHRIGNQPRW